MQTSMRRSRLRVSLLSLAKGTFGPPRAPAGFRSVVGLSACPCVCVCDSVLTVHPAGQTPSLPWVLGCCEGCSGVLAAVGPGSGVGTASAGIDSDSLLSFLLKSEHPRSSTFPLARDSLHGPQGFRSSDG